jgi:hypothetical protein
VKLGSSAASPSEPFSLEESLGLATRVKAQKRQKWSEHYKSPGSVFSQLTAILMV